MMMLGNASHNEIIEMKFSVKCFSKSGEMRDDEVAMIYSAILECMEYVEIIGKCFSFFLQKRKHLFKLQVISRP